MLDPNILNFALQVKTFAALVVIIVAGSIIHIQLKSKRCLPLPPGPPAHWPFGTPIPADNQSQQFAAWISQYGPVVSLRMGPKTMVIVGRYKESIDIMDKQGGLLVGRPRTIAAGEILSRGLRLILAPAEPHTPISAAESYAPIQMNAARDLILDILNDPKRHQAHANRYAASVILRVAYGKSTPTATDAPEIIMINKMLERFQILMRPGAMLVEKLPVLKHVPFYASYIETWRQEESKLFHDQLNRVSRELKTGNAGPSFGRYLLENKNTHGLSHNEMAYLAGSLFGAGSDTTSVAIMVVVMAAACHPEAQDAVQDELDNVVGRERAPTFDDYDSLPQIKAFNLECLRWRPVTTLGFAHCAATDIPYKGFCIPKGAIVYGNHWAISRDPEMYPNPDKFDPQRWLNSEGRIRDDLKFPSFGFGTVRLLDTLIPILNANDTGSSRVCPGQHVATWSVFLNTALLLWSFRITQDPDSPIDDMGFIDSITSHPKPFDARFAPRIRDEEHLKDVMAKYGGNLSA